MEKLIEQLDELIKRLEDSKNFEKDLDQLRSIYPFNKYEYIISTLFSHGKITFDEYLTIRDEYINRNLYLYLFEMAPRTFGDTWGLSHVCSIESDFKRPSKNIDKSITVNMTFTLTGQTIKANSTISKLK